MKKLLLFLSFISCAIITIAQPHIVWRKSLGGGAYDNAKFVEQTADGGYIVAGESKSTDGDVTGSFGSLDCWIVKLNGEGAIQWQKALGGIVDNYVKCIQQTADHGYVVAVQSPSIDGNSAGNHGVYDYWVVKLDSAGTIQWQKSYGGTSWDNVYAIQPTSDGGYIACGSSSSRNGDVTGNHGSFDYWVIKLNGAGDIQWQKSLGGTGNDFAYTIQQTVDGGYIVGGSSNSKDGDVKSNRGGFDYWVVKLDGTGSMQWQKSFGGTGEDNLYSIQQTADGGYIVAGQTASKDGDVKGNHGGFDYWIIKLNKSGNDQWQKVLGGTGDDNAYSIRQTTDGGFIVAGESKSRDGDVIGNHGGYDYWILKLLKSGEIEWQKSLGGTDDDNAYCIRQVTDGGYVIAGKSSSIDGDVKGNHGSGDFWIVKLSSQ